MANIFDLFKSIEKKESHEPISAILVGLGNVGQKYDGTRHNAGFIAIDHIAQKAGIRLDRMRFHSMTGEGVIGGVRVLLMKPETFMNNSGIAVGEAATFYKIPAERVIVLHDEISFDTGVIRIRRKGSAGGHNGLKSLIEHLGGDGFPRIKIGVGKKPTPDYDLVDWVLGRMSKDDMERLGARLDDIDGSVRLILEGKIDEAMCQYSR